jgi:Cu2+-exporting ATPase
MEASDLVKSKADVLLLSRKLNSLPDLFRIARKTRYVTRQNLAWAAAYNLTAIPFAALGLMPPWLAALGMATSSTLVMLNASRLLSAQSKQEI